MKSKILELVKEKYKTVTIDDQTIDLDWIDKCYENTLNEDTGFGIDLNFGIDIETAIEWDEPDTITMDKDVKIEREICFECTEGIFVQIYTDIDYNINKMFLDID